MLNADKDSQRNEIFTRVRKSLNEIAKKSKNITFEELESEYISVRDRFAEEFSSDQPAILDLNRLISKHIFMESIHKGCENRVIDKFYNNLCILGFADLAQESVLSLAYHRTTSTRSKQSMTKAINHTLKLIDRLSENIKDNTESIKLCIKFINDNK